MCFLRAKSVRVITFEQFNQAITELAPKRFKGKSKEEALQQLYGLIAGKEPANAGITVRNILNPHCPVESFGIYLLFYMKRLRARGKMLELEAF